MENEPVAALKRIRSDFLRDLAALDKTRKTLCLRIRQVEADLTALGHKPVRILDTRPRRHMFRRGEMQRLVADILRDEGTGITDRELALALLRKIGLEESPNIVLRELASRVGVVRRRLTAGANANRL